MRQYIGNQLQVISNKKIHFHFSFLIIFLGIVSYSLRNVFCTAELFLLYSVQLVASKLPVEIALFDKALTLLA